MTLDQLSPRQRLVLDDAVRQLVADVEQIVVALLEDGVRPADILATLLQLETRVVPILVESLLALER